VIAMVAALLVLRAGVILWRIGRDLLLSRHTARALRSASEPYEGARVLASEEPQAFVVGVFSPRVYVSRGLLALGPAIAEPALAHEGVHTARRDLFWRAFFPIIAGGHVPPASRELAFRLARDQELAADAEAAATLEDGRLRLAEALISLARRASQSAPGIPFSHGDVQVRVRALLDDVHPRPQWPTRVLALSALLVPLAVGASHDAIHHGLETLLGALS
jgi:Zn-dependent protease with chaperone function